MNGMVPTELSEAEQLELVMRESKIDALSPEEQVRWLKIAIFLN
jgi:hypothetical protein